MLDRKPSPHPPNPASEENYVSTTRRETVAELPFFQGGVFRYETGILGWRAVAVLARATTARTLLESCILACMVDGKLEDLGL